MKNDLKPCIVIVGPIPPPYAGPEIDTLNMLNSDILKNEFNLYHLNTQKHSSNQEKGTISLKNIVKEIKHSLFLILLMIRYKPKCLFLPISQSDLGFFRDTVFIFISKVLGAKVLAYLVGGAYDVFYNRSRSAQLVKYVLSISDLIIVLSKAVKGQIKKIIHPDFHSKIKIVPLDIELGDYSEGFRKNDNKIFKILHLGHISVAKGAFDLVKSIPYVIKKFQKTKFLFAGEFINKENNINFITDPHGSYNKIINFIIENKLDNNVEFLGVVTGKDKVSLLKDVDIQVLASYSEGCPRAVFEGMLAGNPVIVTPVGDLSEIVLNGKNGFVVNFGSPKEIADGICKILGNPKLRQQIGEANKKLVMRLFSPEKRFNQFVKLFNELI